MAIPRLQTIPDRIKAFLSKLTISHASKATWLAVVIIVSFVGGMMFWKAKAIVVPKQNYAAPVVIHDSTKTVERVREMLHDTTKPTQNFWSGLTKITLAPMTDVTYLPMNSVDSTIFSRFWLITGLRYDGSSLVVSAVNLPTRAVREQTFDVGESTFDVGTNSSSVWVVRHNQWAEWDGLSLGPGYSGQAYAVVQTGLLFFRKVDLSLRLTTSQYPLQLEIKWRVL